MVDTIIHPIPGRFALTAAGAGDALLVARLHRMCFEDAWSAESVRDLLASSGVVARIAWRGAAAFAAGGSAAAAGFVIHRIVGEEAELMALAVAPDQRGLGLGRGLLASALSQVSAAGVRAMYLEVAIDNMAAQSLYKKQGFIQVGQRRAYYRMPDGRQIDALVFRLGLPPAGAAFSI